MKQVAVSDLNTYTSSTIAADDLTIGDDAVLLSTSSGNITIDAAANDSDIIIKGTDGGADTTFLTIDGSAGGQFHFNDGTAALPIISNAGDTDTGLLFSAANVMSFSAGGTAQFTMADGAISPVTDSDVDLGTSSLYYKDAYIDTITTTGNVTVGGNLILGSATVTEAQAEILDGATVTTTELNLIDGGATVGTTAIADGDGLLHNDAGTMRVTTVQTFATYFASEITAMSNLVTTGALDSGSITSGFGNIDNGASNITSGGLVKLDVDVDADDVSADSATGRLTLGASEDLNLYHGGTHSYIVNDTGNLVIDTAGDLTFDAAGNDFKFLANGTEILNITNSSSDVIIKPLVDAKDIIFQQRDGTEVARIEDNATFNVSSVDGKFAIAGTAVTSTAADY